MIATWATAQNWKGNSPAHTEEAIKRFLFIAWVESGDENRTFPFFLPRLEDQTLITVWELSTETQVRQRLQRKLEQGVLVQEAVVAAAAWWVLRLLLGLLWASAFRYSLTVFASSLSCVVSFGSSPPPVSLFFSPFFLPPFAPTKQNIYMCIYRHGCVNILLSQKVYVLST
jgi:hypothetical protein